MFKQILRRNDGKSIAFNDDQLTPIQYSSDTWGAELLCAICESNLNTEFDAYGQQVLRGQEGKVLKDEQSVLITGVDARRLRMFFLAILWRAAMSPHDAYLNVLLPVGVLEELRLSLHTGMDVPLGRYVVNVRRFKDSSGEGQFSDSHLREFIPGPFGRKGSSGTSFCFSFLGFFVEIHLPGADKAVRKRLGVVGTRVGGRSTLVIPYIEVLSIPEILSAMVAAYGKHDQGLSRIKPR